MGTRYALVGVGGRGIGMFARPLVNDFPDVAELVALCDLNPHRMDVANRQLGTSIPTYTDWGAMLREVRPDAVVVCTVDRTHHTFIIGALEAGCDVITEKPMTTTAENARAILKAERRTGCTVKVSFNARYGVATEELKRQLAAGTIGQLIAVDFAEYLDTSHGADYFRRWHRHKANSGGLLIHKASHHFDQLNWWVASDPEVVYAMGATRFYGPTRDERGERCLTCEYTDRCEFFLDARADERMNALYLQAEHADGYYRDRCVFGEGIDTEDTLVLSAQYANGVYLSYSLVAFSPYEGQRIGFSGTAGRMEVDLVDRYHGPDADGVVRRIPMGQEPVIRVSPLFGRPYEVALETREGGHGGADERIREHLFRADTPDPLGQRAGSRAGAMSVLLGAAGNLSIESGRPVRVADLL